jgi:superfamily II DNA or RNA helicase
MPTDIREQIARRRQRALEEITKVVNQGEHPIFSTFAVSSQSGQTYRVEVRSLDELQNSCTCADYKTNLIGTCKHIEGVLLFLQKKHGERLAELAKKRPAGAQVYLHYGEDIAVRVGLPLPRVPAVRALLTHYFGPDGVLIGSALENLPRLFAALEELSSRERKFVRVAEAVREHLELLQDREAVQQQKEWFLEQVKSGHRSFGVLATKLYPYQEQGAMHLAFGRRAMLADDMGLGKTVQAIAAAALLKELRGIERVLIITPASLKHQWAREIRRFTSLPATVISGNLQARRAAYRSESFFIILNYEVVRRDLAELEQMRPSLIILDEAQRIKNWRSKTAQAVKRLKSRYAFVLTGTPLENRLDELYSIFQFLDPRILGPLWHFNDRFYDLEKRDDGSYKVIGYKNFAELRSVVEPYSMRRTRDEVLKDLPERIDNNFFVEMTGPQWAAYDGFRENVAQLVSIAKRRPLTPKEHDILLMSLLKMRIICNALALHDKEIPAKDREKTAPKLRELEHVLTDEIANNGHKAVVFSQWTGMLELTKPIVKRVGLGYVTLTGSVPSGKRGALIEKFFDDPDCRVFLSTDAGGVGLNLQAASLVVNLDLPWNPAVLEQRIGRAHRHGQLNPVHVVNLIAQGTIEEKMLDTLAAKRNVFAGVFGTEEAPNKISFHDAGQGLLKRLDTLLGAPARAAAPVIELELTPAVAPAEPEAPSAKPRQAAPVAKPRAAPTLKGFAESLVAKFASGEAGRILLVRQAPMGEGVLVIVDQNPAELRPAIELLLTNYFESNPPILHLMEQEGYRALTAFLPTAPADDAEAYRASALPAPVSADHQRRVKKSNEGLDFAAKRLALAEVLLKGGFPEEMLRPIREALGWAFNSLLALRADRDPSGDLPAPRLIQSELVEPGHLPDDLAARLARVRELTAPATAGDAPAPAPLTARVGETLTRAVSELIEMSRKQAVAQAL